MLDTQATVHPHKQRGRWGMRLALFFFFSSWLIMIFWGVVAPGLDLGTISYVKAMVVTIALWLAVVPVVWATTGRRVRRLRWGRG